MKTKILIIGSTGLLGSSLLKYFSKQNLELDKDSDTIKEKKIKANFYN